MSGIVSQAYQMLFPIDELQVLSQVHNVSPFPSPHTLTNKSCVYKIVHISLQLFTAVLFKYTCKWFHFATWKLNTSLMILFHCTMCCV